MIHVLGTGPVMENILEKLIEQVTKKERVSLVVQVSHFYAQIAAERI